MRIGLVNPNWDFTGSIYFGCREPHLPLEFGYAAALLADAGHRCRDHRRASGGARRCRAAGARCRVCAGHAGRHHRAELPVLALRPAGAAGSASGAGRLAGLAAVTVAVGPHGSTTPRAALRKLVVDAVVQGECEEVLVRLADYAAPRLGRHRRAVPSRGRRDHRPGRPAGRRPRSPAGAALAGTTLRRHAHHHHRFDAAPAVPGAEMEASRGCPYRCTFCAKENFRDRYRRRPLATILAELDGLIEAGVGYVYFIDEIFLPWRELLEAVARRPVAFGVQTRIDLWREDMLDLLGAAGCVSIEAGVESLTAAGRQWLDKDCRLTTDELTPAGWFTPSARSLRAGQSDRQRRRRPRRGRALAHSTARRGRVGQRAGAALSLSGLAGLPAAVGIARRSRLGARARSLPRPPRRVQRHPGERSRAGSGNWRRHPGDAAAGNRADDRRYGRRRVVVRARSVRGAAGDWFRAGHPRTAAEPGAACRPLPGSTTSAWRKATFASNG